MSGPSPSSGSSRPATRSTVLDDLSTGHADLVAPGARLVQGSFGDRDAVAALLRDGGIEAVLHCGAKSLVGESMRDPAAYYRTNVVGGVALLDAMRDAGVGRIVFSSSAAVYGDPEATPIPEDAALRPINPYGESKRTFEGRDGLVRVRLRPAQREPPLLQRRRGIGGDGERHDPETHLIPNVLAAVEGGQPLTLFGDDYPTPDGTPIRDYIHVMDLADAHLAALEATAPGDRADGRPARLQPRERRRVQRARGARGGGRRRRAARAAHGRAAPGGGSAGARRHDRSRGRGPRLAAATFHARGDDRLGLGLAARAPGSPRGLRRQSSRKAQSRRRLAGGCDSHAAPVARAGLAAVSRHLDMGGRLGTLLDVTKRRPLLLRAARWPLCAVGAGSRPQNPRLTDPRCRYGELSRSGLAPRPPCAASRRLRGQCLPGPACPRTA